MSRVTVAILFYILAIAAPSAAEAPVESPKSSKATTPAKAPEATKKAASAKALEAAAAPMSRKSGPATAPATTSTPPFSMDEASSPLPPSTSTASPATEGPAEGPDDADHSGAVTLGSGTAMAGVAAAVADMVFY